MSATGIARPSAGNASLAETHDGAITPIAGAIVGDDLDPLERDGDVMLAVGHARIHPPTPRPSILVLLLESTSKTTSASSETDDPVGACSFTMTSGCGRLWRTRYPGARTDERQPRGCRLHPSNANRNPDDVGDHHLMIIDWRGVQNRYSLDQLPALLLRPRVREGEELLDGHLLLWCELGACGHDNRISHCGYLGRCSHTGTTE